MSPEAQKVLDDLSLKSRMRQRETNLPMTLGNDKLYFENHKLNNQVEEMKGLGWNVDTAQIAVDAVLIDLDKRAMDASKRLTQVFVNGDTTARERLSKAEAAFDEAVTACHPKLKDGGEPYRTSDEVQHDCESLNKIIAEIVAAVPNPRPTTPSLFTHLNGSVGERYVLRDKAMLVSDEHLVCAGHQQEKRDLILSDDLLLDAGYQIWSAEIEQIGIVAFNKRFPNEQQADIADVIARLIQFHKELDVISVQARRLSACKH